MSRSNPKSKKTITIGVLLAAFVFISVYLVVLSVKADQNFEQGNLKTAVSQYKIVTTFRKGKVIKGKLALAKYEKDAVEKITLFYDQLQRVKEATSVSHSNRQIMEVTKSIESEFSQFDRLETDLDSEVADYVRKVKSDPRYQMYKQDYLTGNAVPTDSMGQEFDGLLGNITKDMVHTIVDGIREIERPGKYFEKKSSEEIIQAKSIEILCKRCDKEIGYESLYCRFCGKKQEGLGIKTGLLLAGIAFLVVILMVASYLILSKIPIKEELSLYEKRQIREGKERELTQIGRRQNKRIQEEIVEQESVKDEVVQEAIMPTEMVQKREGSRLETPKVIKIEENSGALEIVSLRQYTDILGTNFITVKVRNNTPDKTVKSYELGFVGFNDEGLRVRVGLAGGRLIGNGKALDQNILPGEIESSGAGWYLDNHNTKTLSACISSVEYHGHGEQWENPDYDPWLKKHM